MPIRVTVDPAARFRSMPQAGGPIRIVFTAHDPIATGTNLRATYTIRPESSYEFNPPSHASKPKVVVGPIETVTVGQREYDQPLTVRQLPGAGLSPILFIDVSIQAVDAQGAPQQLAGQTVPPIECPVGIDIDFV
ncbi:MAG: hypothetical protein ACRD3G_00895 [Vicinamibacterales bacterium]